MKNKFKKIIISCFILCISQLDAQQVFVHTATSTNTRGNVTTLDHAGINNKPDAFVMISQVYADKKMYNPHEIGVYYVSGKWRIFNQDLQSIPVNAQFNVLIIDKTKIDASKASIVTHTSNSGNTSGHVTTINNSLANNDPNAKLIVTQNWGTSGPYNNHSIGVWYSAGKWTIYNEDRKPLPNNAKFNVLIIKSGAAVKTLGPSVEVNTTLHKVNASNIKGYNKSLSQTNYPTAASLIFATHNYGNGPYHTSPFGFMHDAGKWSIFNQDKTPMAVNTSFNVLSLTKSVARVVVRRSTSNTARVRPATSDSQSGTVRVRRPRTETTSSSRRVVAQQINKDSVKYIPLLSTNALAKFYVNIADAQNNTTQNFESKGLDIEAPTLPIFVNLQADLGNRFNYNETSSFSRIDAEIYPDKEKRSGVFYYKPNSYHLNWDEDLNKYDLSINYSRNTEDRANKNTRVNAKLTSGITLSEVRFIEAMLKEMLKNDLGVSNPKVQLKPLPVTNPRIELSGAGFDISDDQISTVGFSDFGQPIEITFTTSDDNIDAIKSGVLQNSLTFKLLFPAANGVEQEYDIPASISVHDKQSYGTFEVELEELSDITNPTPYPLLMNYLHVLTTKNTSEGIKPIIYSFDLGRKTVQPGDIIKFNKPQGFTIPNELKSANKPLKAFIDYRLLDCDDCTRIIINEITGGLVSATKQEVKFRAQNLLKSTGAEFVWIYMKSKQLDPGKQNEIPLYDPIEIEEDNEYISSPTLYLYDGEEPNFQYKVSLVMPNGEVYEMNRWMNENSLRVLLSASSLKSNFNQWPENPEETNESEE